MDNLEWTCPECNYTNDASMLKCSCGYEISHDESVLGHDDSTSPASSSTTEPITSSGNIDGILERVLEPDQNRRSWVKNLVVLLVSLSLFVSAGIFRWDAVNLIAIASAIFIHELGHLLAMRYMGYQNLQMLFIPLVGGIASGKPKEEVAADNAAVILSGPLLGLLSAIVSGILFSFTGMDVFRIYSHMAVILNVLNLLPIYPLDGGRFFSDLLFYRYMKLEMTFRVVAALLLFIAAFKLYDWILFLIGLIVIIPLKTNIAIAQITKEHIKKHGTKKVVNKSIVEELNNKLTQRIPALKRSSKSQQLIASHIKNVINKSSTHHATPKQIFVLLSFYIIALILLPSFALLTVR